MMCNLSLVLYHLLLNALKTLTLHGSTSVLISIRLSLAIRLEVLIIVNLLVASCWALNDVQPLSNSLSLISKCFRSFYAPWKYFSANRGLGTRLRYQVTDKSSLTISLKEIGMLCIRLM